MHVCNCVMGSYAYVYIYEDFSSRTNGLICSLDCDYMVHSQLFSLILVYFIISKFLGSLEECGGLVVEY